MSDLKFELKVIGSREQILAFMTSGAAVAGNVATITTATNDDDDNGPANVNAPNVDASGLPWDARIHSEKKTMGKDNTWRKRRGVDPALVTSVENELRARTAQQAGMYMPPPNNAPPITTPVMQPMQQPQYQPQPGPGPQYGQPGMTTPPQQPQYQPGPAPAMDFNAFMSHLSNKMNQRDANGMPIIDAGYLASLSQKLSQSLQRPINHIAEVSNDPNAIAMAINFLTADGKWN